MKEETNTKRQCPVSPISAKAVQMDWNRSDYGRKDLWKRWVLSLE